MPSRSASAPPPAYPTMSQLKPSPETGFAVTGFGVDRTGVDWTGSDVGFGQHASASTIETGITWLQTAALGPPPGASVSVMNVVPPAGARRSVTNGV